MCQACINASLVSAATSASILANLIVSSTLESLKVTSQADMATWRNSGIIDRENATINPVECEDKELGKN